MDRRLFIGFLVALILLSYALDQLGYMAPVRATVQWMLLPSQQALTPIIQTMFGQANSSSDLIALQERVLELEQTNNRLLIENIQLRELERENSELKQLLNYTRNNPQFVYQPTFVTGTSIGADPINFLYYILVDVGARDGVAGNMPVITDRGLVGRVTAISANAAQVILLIDPASAVNAVTQNSRAPGVIRGGADGSVMMDRIPQGVTVSPGEIVLTSGLGGNFPARLVIGQVTEVRQSDQEQFQVAQIRPTVDFGNLNALLVITSFEPVDLDQELLEIQGARN